MDARANRRTQQLPNQSSLPFWSLSSSHLCSPRHRKSRAARPPRLASPPRLPPPLPRFSFQARLLQLFTWIPFSKELSVTQCARKTPKQLPSVSQDLEAFSASVISQTKRNKQNSNKKNPNNLPQNKGQSNNNHEAMSNDWLENGQCPLAKSYRAIGGVVPLVAKLLTPPAGAMALTIAASILGQTIGSRAERIRLKRAKLAAEGRGHEHATRLEAPVSLKTGSSGPVQLWDPLGLRVKGIVSPALVPTVGAMY
ncbi:hypothetical protein ZWY2020_005528 [Hordeum vulgare]|nr:hypothetical protein ZWY2020_005528 [Hordeum vulgare]